MKYLFKILFVIIILTWTIDLSANGIWTGYQVFFNEGKKQFQNCNYEQAAIEFNCALRCDPTKAEARNMMNLSKHCKAHRDTADICFEDQLYRQAYCHYSAVAQNNANDMYCRDRMGETFKYSYNSIKDMVEIPSGVFMMGSKNGSFSEQPVHAVKLSSFYMDKDEVTNEQFCTYINIKGLYTPEGRLRINLNNPNCHIKEVKGWFYSDPGFEKYPVVAVSWYGATDYAAWLNKSLPTEAQMEYAFGDAQYPCDPSVLQPAGMGEVNNFGLRHMCGNVWEWTSDSYLESAYRNSEMVKDPSQNEVTEYKSYRGGSFIVIDDINPKTYRGFGLPTDCVKTIGFRCVKNLHR